MCEQCVLSDQSFWSKNKTITTLHDTIFLIHQLIEKLSGMGVSSELCQVIAGCVWVRRGEVRSQMVRDSCAISHSHLTDFDWRVKVHQD